MKTITLNLSAGTLNLGPMLAATIRDNEEEIDRANKGLLGQAAMMKLTTRLACACAQRLNPSVTLADVENMIDLDNFGRVAAGCWGVSVPEPEEPQAGEGQAVESPTS